MDKRYEKHGVPKQTAPLFGRDEIPAYATGFGRLNCDSPHYRASNGFTKKELQFWFSLDNWTPIEAALVLSGINPFDEDIYMIDSCIQEREIFIWKHDQEFAVANKLLEIFYRSDLYFGAYPRTWIAYTLNKIKQFDPCLLAPKARDNHQKQPINVTNVFNEAILWLDRNEKADLKTINNGSDLNNSPTKENSLNPKERDTLLKIIGGLAMDGYGMNIHSNRLAGVSDLLNQLADKGVTIDQDTLSKHLKAAAALIPKPKLV